MGPPVCNFTSLMRHFALQYTATLIMYGLALNDLRWLNVWNGCRVGTGRTGRTFVAIAAWCVIDVTRNCYWCAMQCGAVCNLPHSCGTLLSEYTATLIMVLRCPSLVECMARVPC